MKQLLLILAVVMFSPVLIGYSRERPAPPPSRYGFTFNIDSKSLPKGVTVREARNESSVRYFIKNTSDVPLIINERFLQNDQLASGAKLVSGRVLHYFPNGVPMQGKRHLKGWQAPFGEITETLLYIKEPKKIYEGRKVGLTKELPKPEKVSIPANLGGKPYEIKGTIKYHLNKAYDVFHRIKNPKNSADAPVGKVHIYKQKGDTAREIEIFFPKDHDPAMKAAPGIIMFHGGGWGGGHRKQFRYLCHYFSTRGLVAATVTYKLASKAGTKNVKGTESRKRVCITDAKSAIRWYKQNAEKLGIDPRKIVSGGGSAGGHISLLATTNPGLNDSGDTKKYDTTVAAYLLFNPALSVADAKDSEVDFLQHLKDDLSPAIVFFGSKDRWLKNGWKAASAKISSLKIADSVDVRIAEGQDHGFFNKQPWTDVTLIEADKFLKALGFLKGVPTLKMPETGEKLEDANKTVDSTR